MLSFLGRLHPLLVHFPIGVLLLAFLLQYAYRKRGKEKHQLMQVLLMTGWLAALVAALTGWIHARAGEYVETSVDQHRWPGYMLVVSLTALVMVHRNLMRQTVYQKIYHVLLWMSMLLLVWTGHYGGLLTHGEINPGRSQPSQESTPVSPENNDQKVQAEKVRQRDSAALVAIRQAGFKVREISMGAGLYEVSAIQQPEINDQAVSYLLALKEYIVRLDLQGTKITDGSIPLISQMKLLENLNLKSTEVTATGLKSLVGNASIQTLNLVNTKADEGLFAILVQMKALKKVYLWNTLITAEQIEDFQKKNPAITLISGLEYF